MTWIGLKQTVGFTRLMLNSGGKIGKSATKTLSGL